MEVPTITSGLGKWETLRIIIPGYFFATLLFLNTYVLLPSEFQFVSKTLPLFPLASLVVGGLIAGLLLYCLDLPRKGWGSIYRKDHPEYGLLPSNYLTGKIKEWKEQRFCQRELVVTTERREDLCLYYWLYNECFSSNFRDKIEYFTSVYYAVRQVYYTSILFACVGVVLGSSLAVFCKEAGTWQATLSITLAVINVLIVFIITRFRTAEDDVLGIFRTQHYFISLHRDSIIDALERSQYSS